ncbi:hypothetical protein CRU98_05005 [Arcobacter sp. CECT 8986]|nr:hypothetical protein CRU98_05005 [Arcobacter sp. CECT 8986]
MIKLAPRVIIVCFNSFGFRGFKPKKVSLFFITKYIVSKNLKTLYTLETEYSFMFLKKFTILIPFLTLLNHLL